MNEHSHHSSSKCSCQTFVTVFSYHQKILNTCQILVSKHGGANKMKHKNQNIEEVFLSDTISCSCKNDVDLSYS